MVEGPGCKVKGEKLRPRVRGQTVRSVRGNVVDRFTKKKKKKDGEVESVPLSPHHALIGQKISDIQTLGKELFIFFEGYPDCLRIHFLMAGIFRVNNENLDGDGGKNVNDPSLEMQLTKDRVSFYKSATDIRSAAECQEKIAALKDLDICGSTFNHKRAVQLVMSQGDRMVCDVLLDQVILPGVGNIIKNEAMFDSGIDPSTKIEALTEVHVSHLVKMTRDFSMIFYKCRKEGTNLQRFMKIYRKGKCGQCGGKVVNTRMGVDSERLTSFCSQCQTNDITKLKARQLPTKNSLLGWVTTGDQQQEPDWSCNACTLINKATRKTCAACGSHNISGPCDMKSGHRTEITELSTETGLTKNNSLGTSGNERKRSSQSVDGGNKRAKLSNDNGSGTTGDISLPCLRSNVRSTRNIIPSSGGNQPAALAQTQAKGDTAQEALNKSTTDVFQRPACPGHNKPCRVQQVHKKGENKDRHFFACSLPRGKQCKFFQWADENFPVCEHAQRCILRTVLKQGANNGRQFFTCGKKKGSQCQFFKWADCPSQ